MSRYITGFHAIEETLKRKNTKGTLFLTDQKGKKARLAQEARKAGVAVTVQPAEEIARLCGTNDHRGAALQVFAQDSRGYTNLKNFLKENNNDNSLIIILDGITDPHNYGAILRSADQFHADLVIVPEKRSAPESNIVVKTSAGAVNWVKISRVPNLVSAIKDLKKDGYWIYGADMNGEDISKADISGKTAIIMGREGEGLHKLTAENCDTILSIPSSGKVDSLNVSVAAGVLMYEYYRQTR